MPTPTRASLLLPTLVVAALAQPALASTPVDRIEFDVDEIDLVEHGVQTVTLRVLQGQYCSASDGGDPTNCGSHVGLSFSVLSSGLDACFITAGNQCKDTTVAGVGASVTVVITSNGAAPSLQALRVRGQFNNLDHTVKTSSLDVHITAAPFLTGPAAVRVPRGFAAIAPFAADHPLSGGAIAVDFDGAPTGLTLIATPASVPVGVGQTSVAITAAPTLAIGDHVVDVIAGVSGHADQVEPLAIAVVNPIHMQLSRLLQVTGVSLGAVPVTIGVAVAREPGVTGVISYTTLRNLSVDVAITKVGDDVSLTLARTALAVSGSTTTLSLRGTVGGVTTTLPILVRFQ